MTGSGVPAVQRWIHRDTARGWVAVTVTFAIIIGYQLVCVFVLDVPPDTLTAAFLAWDGYGLTYSVLTVLAFAGTRPEDLATLTRRRRASGLVQRFLNTGDGPGTAVTLAVVALGGAALLPRLELFTTPGNQVLLTVVLIVAVAASWIVVVLSYAVHYARRDVEERGLRFPDDSPVHGWIDYVYFSLAVAATFGTTDVVVTSTRMRRTVLAHAALTFVFNTIIIALLVAALTG